MKKITVAFITICLLSPMVFAKTKDEIRDERQQKRIQEGTKSGQLTDTEQSQLAKGQERVNKHQSAAVADGTITDQEKKHLNKLQNVQSRKIHRKKQN